MSDGIEAEEVRNTIMRKQNKDKDKQREEATKAGYIYNNIIMSWALSMTISQCHS